MKSTAIKQNISFSKSSFGTLFRSIMTQILIEPHIDFLKYDYASSLLREIYEFIFLQNKIVNKIIAQVLSRDSVTVSVEAVVYYRVSNPTMAVSNTHSIDRDMQSNFRFNIRLDRHEAEHFISFNIVQGK